MDNNTIKLLKYFEYFKQIIQYPNIISQCIQNFLKNCKNAIFAFLIEKMPTKLQFFNQFYWIKNKSKIEKIKEKLKKLLY